MDSIRALKELLFAAFAGAAIVCLGGCSGKSAAAPDGTAEGSVVYIRAVQEVAPRSRTYIGGEALDRTFWSERDRIGVYWRPRGSADELAGQPFRCYRLYPGEALFSSTVADIPAGEYDYYGAYPVPNTVSGTTAVYTLPAVQDGTYEMQDADIRTSDPQISYAGNCDFMVAAPVTGPALTQGAELPPLRFYHQCHIMRIQVPAGRNRWGERIAKLRVEFPSAVVGNMEVNIADPFAAPRLSEGVSTVWAELKKPLSESEENSPEGNYVWLFLCPGVINGTVTFTAYDGNGYQSHSVSVAMEKTLEAGKITPVNLTVPEELPLTWIDFEITGNNLGEEPRKLTVKAPEGGRFRNGTDTCSFVAQGAGKYSLAFYDSYDGLDNGAILRGGDFTITYESDNAIVAEKRRIGEFTPQGRTAVALTVPYLLYEDFSGAAGTGQNDGDVELSGYNLPGWSGSHFALEGGTAARLSAYLGSSALTDPDGGANTRGRLDTQMLTQLKEGANVTLSVSFDVGGTKQDGTLSNCKVLYSTYEFGSDTKTGAVAYTQGIENIVVAEDAGTDGSYTNIPLHKENIEVTGCTNRHRLSWRTSFRVYDPNWWSALTAKTVYVYIDNIKVSIKRQ